MRFRVGSRVEVLGRNKEPYDSWFPAKILSVSGCEYEVRFEHLTVEGRTVVEKVPEEDVRPSPPPARGKKRWVLGDITEVFDICSWRVGKVVKVLQKNYFVIKLFGCIQLKEFHVSNLRIRQDWQDNQWIITDKDHKIGGKRQIDSTLIHSKDKNARILGCKAQIRCQTHKKDPLGILLRSSTTKKNLKFQFNTFPSASVTRTSKRNKTLPGCSGIAKRALPQEVHGLSFPTYMDGDKFSHESFRGRAEMGAEKVNKNNHAKQSCFVPLQVAEDNNECSVASCSANDLAGYTIEDPRKSSKETAGSFPEDGASICPFKSATKCLHSARQSLAAGVHELELRAYQTTVRALFASGPLSWEQESLLTNLRLSLHISNEEHLIQLRNLLST